MIPNIYRHAALALLAASTVPATMAQSTEADAWEVTSAAGLSLADGNANSLAYSLQMLASRVTTTDEIYLGADYFYAADNGLDTTNSLHLSGQYNRLINDRLYYGVAGSYLNDQVADLDYRIDLNALIGYYLLKEDAYNLAVEAGPGYTWEKQGGITDDYLNLRFGEKFEYNISAGAKLWQSITYTPEAGDFSNYLLTADIGLDTFITQQWALRTFFRYQRDNTPAAGREADDYSLMVGLSYSLAGFPEPEKPGRRTLKPDRKPAAAAAMGWTTTAALGYSLASGNSDNSSMSLMYDSAYRSATDEFFFNGAYVFGENNSVTSLNNVRAGIQYNHIIAPTNYYVGAGTGFFHDDLADLKYRITPAVVGGVYLIKDDASALSVEAGPGYTFEKVGNTTNDYFALQAAERFAYTISPRCTFNQALIYNTEAADFNNYTLTATAYLDTDITTNLALRVATAYIFDSTPAAGREHHDTTLTSGIAVKF